MKLKRKGLKNRQRAISGVQSIKNLNAQPVIKNIDVEAIKKEFAEKKGNPVQSTDSQESES